MYKLSESSRCFGKAGEGYVPTAAKHCGITQSCVKPKGGGVRDKTDIKVTTLKAASDEGLTMNTDNVCYGDQMFLSNTTPSVAPTAPSIMTTLRKDSF